MVGFPASLRPAGPTGPDTLAKERAQSSLPVKELAEHLLSSDYLKRQERIVKELEKEELLSKMTQQNLSRPDRYKLGLARAKLLRRMSDRLGWSFEDYKLAEYLVDDVSPYMLHMNMFVTTIREQGSEEQKAHWLPKIENWQIIGAYAQTELGHGSNVRGIELQAKMDPKSKGFILHSPTLTASKWWNGTLGRTANHAIVVAQLMLPKKYATAISTNTEYTSHGPHPFIVQVRDLKSHQPLPGIAIGDIGPKYGYASMDNGYMLFDNFRIPHSAFLNRYAKIDPNTSLYSKPSNPAVVYGSLTYVRANIIMDARLVLARAVTIAIRYLSIRHQFWSRDNPDTNGPEEPVLNYPTVQIRILPLLATTFALNYTGQAVRKLYMSTRLGISTGDFSTLADLHSTSSGLKSLCTTLAANGIEVCRRAMGGHGFGGGSGLIQLNADYLSKPTIEGDNWMITQQTASHLLKKVSTALADPDAPAHDSTDENLKYYLKASKSSEKGHNFDIMNSDLAILHAFRFRAAFLAVRAHERRVVKGESWNKMLVQLHALSNAHSQALLIENFYTALYPTAAASSPSSFSTNVHTAIPDGARSILQLLFRLFALTTLQDAAVEFLHSGAVTLEQVAGIEARVNQLICRLRPHAVALVDAWTVPDYLLDSALGRSDGRVYEDLFERASDVRRNPLNAEVFNPWYWDEEIVMGSGRGWDGDCLARGSCKERVCSELDFWFRNWSSAITLSLERTLR